MSEAEFFLAVFAMIAGTVLAFPLVRALGERLRPRVDAGVKEELQGLRDDLLTELRDMRRELSDLGERVDFAERLLAKHREASPPQIGRGA